MESIQWLRGVAALLVLCVHAIGVAQQRSGGKVAFALFVPNLGGFGDSGVDLFFIISGFVMAHSLGSARNARSFMVARWRRIWPLFVLVSAAFLLLFGGAAALTPAKLISTLTLLPLTDTGTYHQPPLVVGWTLGFEAMFYLLVAATIRLRRGAGTLFALTVCAAFAGLIVAPDWAPARMLINPITAEFALGIAVWLVWRGQFRGLRRPVAMVLGVALLIAGVAGLLPLGVPTEPVQVAAGGLLSLNRVLVWGVPWAMVVFGLLGESGKGRAATIWRALGDASYSIYLVHFIAIDAVGALVPLSTTALYSFVVVSSSASIALGLVVHGWVERPLLSYLSSADRIRSISGPVTA